MGKHQNRPDSAPEADRNFGRKGMTDKEVRGKHIDDRDMKRGREADSDPNVEDEA